MSRSDMLNACEDYDEDGCAWSRREAARIKQIQIGKARPEYQRYLKEVPHSRRNSSQPSTPDPRARVSKRQFDRALGDWRRRLHEFDAVPRGPPRHHHAEVEAPWPSNGQQSSKNLWGPPSADPRSIRASAGCGQSPRQESPGLSERAARSSNRRARANPPPRGERSGKFGPRKSADSPIKELPLPEPALRPPPPPPQIAPAVADAQSSQQCAVRISLADQLMEIPMQPTMAAMPEWQQWYQGGEAAWGMIETPQKTDMMGMVDYQFMLTETPPDKPMMPGHTICQQPVYDDSMLKADDPYLGMPAENYMSMLPHRLFDSSPEKSDRGAILETHSSTSETALESGDSLTSPEPLAPESPRARPEKQDSLMPLMSPQPRMSPPTRGLTTPTPATPKRQCYVPETPSPDRMHQCSWMHPPMPYMQPTPLGGLPWHYGAQATDQVMPEFLHMMPSIAMAQEGQSFGDTATL